MSSAKIASVDGVVDVEYFGTGPTKFVLEVPHGATLRSHFDKLRAQLRGSFPEDLVDFFFVNTDVGAPELAVACARELVKLQPSTSVVVLRCQIPRTFIDCNRVMDASTKPSASTAAGMTPGVVRYVTQAADFVALFAKYSAYRGVVERAIDDVCGDGGMAVMVHSYAPRSVDVPVDEKIVERLRAAYQPDVEPTWPLRPDVDLITRTPEGDVLADPNVVERTRAELGALGFVVKENETYPLHPSSLAHVFATKWRGKTLCLEVRRDRLVAKFTPFQEMRGDDVKCAPIGAALARALVR